MLFILVGYSNGSLVHRKSNKKVSIKDLTVIEWSAGIENGIETIANFDDDVLTFNYVVVNEEELPIGVTRSRVSNLKMEMGYSLENDMIMINNLVDTVESVPFNITTDEQTITLTPISEFDDLDPLILTPYEE